MTAAIVWFRRDLRLNDNPALIAAAELKVPIVPLFIWSPQEEAPWAPGAATKWWLHFSLESLQKSLEDSGLKLIIKSGSSLEVLEQTIKETKADYVFWNRLYEPAIRSRDEKIKTSLKTNGIDVRSFNSHLLYEPWRLETAQGNPFQVFTPFYKASEKISVEEPQAAPKKMMRADKPVSTLTIENLSLLPKINWDKTMRNTWTPGELQAEKSLKYFLQTKSSDYQTQRDFPSVEGTSKLSPHLHFGEIGPRQIWHSALKEKKTDFYRREIVWREFAHHILFHFPQTQDQPLRKNFEKFPWRNEDKILSAWQRGETGIPIVDAGMKELWQTGWMHNRVRMIVASFLTKHLLHSWLDGAKWFWETLVDADLANNSLGWQWAGGCGADAAPYFRVFNPDLQAEKFDSAKVYIKRWNPDFDKPHYPRPIIDLKEGRERALAAFDKIKTPSP